MLPLILVLAAAPIEPGSLSKLLGWSADGESLVWSEMAMETSAKHRYFNKTGKKAEVPMATVMTMPEAERKLLKETVSKEDENGEIQIDEKGTIIVVHNVRTGAEVKYLASVESLTLQAKGVLKTRLSSLLDAAAFEEWKKTNDPTSIKGLEGPNGSRAKVLADGKATLSWTAEDTVTVSYVVTRGADKSIVSHEEQMEAMFTPHRSAEVWWDSSGRRALFIITTAEARTMRGVVGPSTQYVVLAAPPRVEVLSSARLTAEAERIAEVVEKTGFAVTTMGPATRDRPATVIYAGGAHMELAQKLAAALPGSTVEKLSWKANAEIVVAVGAPAK